MYTFASENLMVKGLTSSVRCAIIMRNKDADIKIADKNKAAKLLQEEFRKHL